MFVLEFKKEDHLHRRLRGVQSENPFGFSSSVKMSCYLLLNPHLNMRM